MGDSLEPGAQLEKNDVYWLREVADASDVCPDGDANQRLWPETKANLERIASLLEVSLSRPLPDPELREKIARAIWWSYWPDQSEQWIREHWECNAKINGDEVQRVPYILADVVLGVLGVDGSAETGKL